MSLEKTEVENRYQVEKLKKIFEKEINSRRRFEEISDIKEVLSVLENRNAISLDTWKTLEENVQNPINSIPNILPALKKIAVPKKVIDLVYQNFESDWKDFGLHLNLTESQLLKCRNVEDVLLSFEENCQGISKKELLFRLIRALEKSNKIELKLEIVQLMANDSV